MLGFVSVLVMTISILAGLTTLLAPELTTAVLLALRITGAASSLIHIVLTIVEIMHDRH